MIFGGRRRELERPQWECGLPVPHMPQEEGLPVQAGSAPAPATLEAKVENFFDNRAEPHFGQGVPSHWVERTWISESFPHCSQ